MPYILFIKLFTFIIKHSTFFQNIDSYVNSCNLRSFLNVCPTAKVYIEKLKCLAYLPAEDIEPMFNHLTATLAAMDPVPDVNDATRLINIYEKLLPVIKYYNKYWIKKTKPENFSVFMEERRTNNDTERNNRAWHDTVGGNHPRVFKFIGTFIYFIMFMHVLLNLI